MNRRALLGALLALPAVSAAAPLRAAGEWVKLSNAQDFSAWKVVNGKLDVWKMEGDTISCVGRGGGCLLTAKEYGDFELRFDYRVPAGGNTGVGIRVPPGGWPSTHAFEIQILDDDHPKYANLKPEHRNGSIYTFIAPRVRAHKPAGEWNRMEVRCQGPQVVIRLNGQEIHNVNLDEHTQHMGKGDLPLGKRPRRGHIGFPRDKKELKKKR